MMIDFRNTFSTEAFIIIIILCFVFTIAPPPLGSLTLLDTFPTEAVPVVATPTALHGWPGGVAARVVVGVAEELGTDPVVVVAGPGPLVCPALLVQGEGGAGQGELARQ